MHKSNETRRVCKWIYSYFIGIVKLFVKMLFYANRAIQSIKPEFWEKNYESRRLLCRKLDVEHPALHSSLPLSTNKSGIGENSTLFSNSTKRRGPNIKELLACPLFIKEISQVYCLWWKIMAAGPPCS